MNRSFTDEEILTREEVMDVLKIGRSTFYKLIKSGDLKGFLEGNRYKVPANRTQNGILTKTTRKQTNAFGLFFACTAAVQVP
mgnify:CR=1 FL=1